jgi:Na+/proline symporter
VAGAKLASATFDGISFEHLLLIMGIFTVIYTALGGLKAVIYTDTIQWLILMVGLLFVGIPAAYYMLGGWDAIVAVLPPEMLRLDKVSPVKMLNWSLTIIPIWFIGMTLYQRIFASRSEREAKRAWFFAGLLEWPLMAFMGVVLGLFARAAFEMELISFPNGIVDPELGLPLLLRTALPVGVTGVILAAYFSAIMSTADSCLMAASGNFISDFLGN